MSLERAMALQACDDMLSALAIAVPSRADRVKARIQAAMAKTPDADPIVALGAIVRDELTGAQRKRLNAAFEEAKRDRMASMRTLLGLES